MVDTSREIFGRAIQKQALDQAEIAVEDRIWDKWNRLIHGVIFKDNPELCEQMPISFIKKEGESTYTKTGEAPLIIPLNGGEELRLSKSVNKYQQNSESKELYDLVFGITIRDPKGEMVNCDDFYVSRISKMRETWIGKLPNRNDEVDKNDLKLIKRWLALFDPQKDIDMEKLGMPTEEQKLVLEAFGIKLTNI